VKACPKHTRLVSSPGRAARLGPVAILVVLIGLPSRAAPGTEFVDGDIVVRTRSSLSIIRQGKQVTAFGTSCPITADDRGCLWAGSAENGAIKLRRYTSTSNWTEHVSPFLADEANVHRTLHWDDSPYVVVSIPREEDVTGPWIEGGEESGRLRGRWVHAISFDPTTESFRRPIPLTDFFGKPELIMQKRTLVGGQPLPKGVRETALLLGLWDATITPSGTLWLSTQGKITAYRIGGLPAGLTKLLNPAKIEGLGQRTHKIDWWISRHGNGTGLTALSDTEIAVVNGNAPGGITLVNTIDPPNSVPLAPSIFPGAPPKWGLSPVVNIGEALLVAHRHPAVATIYRVSRTTGDVSVFASDIAASGMARIQK
jgi:hypothetical protein